jgi:hypothetical protein
MIDEDILLFLSTFKSDIEQFTNPEVLKKFLDLREALGGDRKSFVDQYKFWIEKNGSDCRYAAMAKNFFLKEQANNVAKAINELYHSWSKFYEGEVK